MGAPILRGRLSESGGRPGARGRLVFLSGEISVVAFLPAGVQVVARFIPTYYGVHALPMAVFYGSNEDLARDLAVTVGTTVVSLILAVASLGRGMAD